MDTTTLRTRNAHPIGLDAFVLATEHAEFWWSVTWLAERLEWTPSRVRAALYDLACASMLLVAVGEDEREALYAIRR
jgi:hypothetical protein